MDNILVSADPWPMSIPSDPSAPTYLRQWRKFRRLTQEQLAERVGMTAPTISQLENNKQGFTGETLAKMAQALGCSPAALLAYDPTEEDSLWPIFEAADRLRGRDKQKIRAILKVALDQFSL